MYNIEVHNIAKYQYCIIAFMFPRVPLLLYEFIINFSFRRPYICSARFVSVCVYHLDGDEEDKNRIVARVYLIQSSATLKMEMEPSFSLAM